MKKYIKYLIPSILIVILLVLILLVNDTKTINSSCYNSIDIQDIYSDINSFNGDVFSIVDKGMENLYLPVDFSSAEDYIVAANMENNEFFIILYKLSTNQLDSLQQFIDEVKKDSIDVKYTLITEKDYVIVTALRNSNSSFKGILNSYVYCK